MASKTIITCDICGEETGGCIKGDQIPVVFTTEQNEGRVVKPHLTIQKIDICACCYDKLVETHPLRANGAMGSNHYYWYGVKG